MGKAERSPPSPTAARLLTQMPRVIRVLSGRRRWWCVAYPGLRWRSPRAKCLASVGSASRPVRTFFHSGRTCRRHGRSFVGVSDNLLRSMVYVRIGCQGVTSCTDVLSFGSDLSASRTFFRWCFRQPASPDGVCAYRLSRRHILDGLSFGDYG